MYDAYHAGVHALRAHVPRRSKAQSGEIGGDVNHEFMAVAAVGEDDFVWCEQLRLRGERRGRATRRSPATDAAGPTRRRARRCTRPTCRGSPAWPSISASTPGELLKCIVFDVDGELGLALVPGDREVNEFALAQARRAAAGAALHRRRLRRAPRARRRATSAPTTAGATLVVADPLGRARRTGGSPARTRSTTTCATRCSAATSTSTCGPSSSTVVPGDPCPRCGAAALGRPRHRGRARVPARHEVRRGARRALHRRGAASSTRW